jgi:hypothetical protein
MRRHVIVVYDRSIRRIGIRLGKLFAISCLSATFPALWASVTVQKKIGDRPIGLALPAR